jgi:phage shock protein PspC (stress-responsive transcriptional regulator)
MQTGAITMNKDYFDDMQARELGLDSRHKKFGGVCAGVAHYLDVPGVFIRLATIAALLIAPQATILAYGLAFFILDDISEQEML